jgi:hypothetical protein
LDASIVFQELASQAVFHAISRTSQNKPGRAATIGVEMAAFVARYSEDRFIGILIDTGAASCSTIGIGQFIAL